MVGFETQKGTGGSSPGGEIPEMLIIGTPKFSTVQVGDEWTPLPDLTLVGRNFIAIRNSSAVSIMVRSGTNENDAGIELKVQTGW